MSDPVDLALRAGAVGVSLVLWFLTQRLIGSRRPHGNGIGDALHVATAGLHGWLEARPRAANVVLAVTSALIDAMGIFLIAASIVGPTLRPFIALLTLFGLRQICQGLSALPAPSGMIWRRPGVPSLFVTYDVGNDFFFSGHTALAVLAAIEVASVAPGWLTAVVAGVAVIEAAAVIVLRAHYTMDVIAAIFAAITCAAFAGYAAPVFDAWLRM